MTKKLTEKQKLFCDYYLIDLNATQAAIKAGYSKKSAELIGSENIRKPYIQAYIQERMSKRADKIEVTAEKVVSEIAKLAFSNATDFLDIKDGRISIKDIEQMDKTFISGAKETFDREGNVTGIALTFHDKTKNLDMLMRHLGLYTEKVELSYDQKITDWMRGTK